MTQTFYRHGLNKRSTALSLLLSLCFFSNITFGQDIVFEGKNILIGTHVSIAIDKNSNQTIATVNELDFAKSQVETPNYGISKSVYWVRFSVENKNYRGDVLLEVAYPMFDTCQLFEVYNDTIVKQSIINLQSFNARPIKHHNFVFNMHLPYGKTKTYYLRVRGSEQIALPILIKSGKGIFESALITEAITGMHIGILLVMALFNLFILFSTKEKTYLYYVLFIVFMAMTHITFSGYGFKYIWPNLPWFNNYFVIIFPALGGVFTILFFRNFLNTKEKVPVMDKFLDVLIVVYFVAIVARILHLDNFSYRIMDYAGLISTLFGIGIAARLSMKDYRPAKFFLLAWTIFLIGIILFVMRNLNILPYNNFTNYTMQAGTDIVVILLSIALADKINTLKKEEEIAREKALEVSLLNEKIIREQNIVLERKVEERTVEVRKANIELLDTLTKLKDAQGQLIEQEKMASLGQLTAGIAHEINNPINFVSSNIMPLKRDIADVLDLLSSFDEVRNVQSMEELQQKIKELDKLKMELDLDYLKEELQMLLKGMEDGAQRTIEIVKGLKIFSRVDESDLNSVNINEGIESTLVILNNQMGSKLKLYKELGNIPLVECYPGKLNQVFMNILTNSIHAVLESNLPDRMPAIWVKTCLEGEDTVVISIKDNGKGMTPEIKAKIFEPFFTTKDVGKGTGLGLSIVFKIIEAHQGTINVISEPGEGAEFLIKLPVKRRK